MHQEPAIRRRANLLEGRNSPPSIEIQLLVYCGGIMWKKKRPWLIIVLKVYLASWVQFNWVLVEEEPTAHRYFNNRLIKYNARRVEKSARPKSIQTYYKYINKLKVHQFDDHNILKSTQNWNGLTIAAIFSLIGSGFGMIGETGAFWDRGILGQSTFRPVYFILEK